MNGIANPAVYEAWYRTPRGAWVAERETALMMRLLAPRPGERLLDVGTGTGHFARRLREAGLAVVGLDPDLGALRHAHGLGGDVPYVGGDALRLPFPDGAFDLCVAVTSLCFVADPEAAVREMWRVARRAILLGLLNRHSLLYRRKRGRGAYAGARWDGRAEALAWLRRLAPAAACIRWGTAVLLPGGGAAARLVERLHGGRLPWGAFLAVAAWRRPPGQA